MKATKLPAIKRASCPCDRCGGKGRIIKADPASLRARREAAGLTLGAFAKSEPKTSVAYASDVELGRRNTTAKVIAKYEALVPA
jgi:Ribonuclease G/E